jgi:hypothetical protein
MIENNKDLLMDWDDSIETDGQEFILLPDGEYNYKVTNFERGRFPGGPKVPACNKAIITLQVETPEGIAIVKFDLLLYRTLEWRISDFFRSIGQKKHGEKLTMDWNKVVEQEEELISNKEAIQHKVVTKEKQTILTNLLIIKMSSS